MRITLIFAVTTIFCTAAAFQIGTVRQHRLSRRYGFFKDIFDGAFGNDPNLSTVDQRKGMLEGPNSVDPESIAPLTETQRAWRERQSSVKGEMAADALENSKFALALYLAGVPSKDPSNDLYGSKVNISTRNKELGLDLPEEPNVNVHIEFLPDGICRCSESPFTSGEDGQWKLSDDGTQLRFSMDVLGYSRTVQTKGSIQRVFWSEEPETTRQTSSEYSIPPGFIYADVKIDSARRPGQIDFQGLGVLRVEQKMGLLGAASKMITVGTFTAKAEF